MADVEPVSVAVVGPVAGAFELAEKVALAGLSYIVAAEAVVPVGALEKV